ncbi:MAG: tyrosine decarboxylase MfnA [Candidatus Heimdallarchaeaceae archaeon]
MEEDIEKIMEYLETELAEDCSYHSGKIFGSMSSYPVEEAVKVFTAFIEKNAGDANIFAGTAKIESKLIQMLGNIFNCQTPSGNFVPGGSEANIVGLWAARNYFQANNKESSSKLEIIAPITRHTSIDKAADLLNVKLKLVQVDQDFRVKIEEVEEKITENTVALVGIAGNTVYGAIDDIESLSRIALENDLWLHVDAAFGGFVIPFIEHPPKFDFTLEGVKSFVVDPHKNLGSPIPNGCILFKDYSYSQYIIHHLPYFSGEKTENRTIVGTKSGAAIIATYYLLRFKGIKWLENRIGKALANTQYLKEGLERRGFEIKGKARLNVIAAKPPEELEQKRNELFRRGWRIGRYGDLWRFVVMPTAKREDVTRLLLEIDK